MPERLAALKTWIGETLSLGDFTIEAASGDASFRRYFRLTLADTRTFIAMDAPPEKEDCHPFVAIADTFSGLGLHVPKIDAADLEQGFLLLEDLGSTHYLDRLDGDSADRLYADALSALAVIQACGPQQELPSYDAAMLQREMALFPEWLLQQQLEILLNESELEQLGDTFQLLADNALAQPQVCVHRDYHSRNLLLTHSPNPGIIDFQDAVVGPVTYDLVSLLRDCYISWPPERVRGWAMGYFELALQSGILRGEHEALFLRWFDLMGVQRHLKAAGIFARLNIRDGKPGYLADIPRTLGYIVEVAADYPELSFLGGLIEERVLPALAKGSSPL
ncbi:MAG: phosphotransferase [Candidatus Sedimenticola sp. (ex Thyasira tokunagai)]